MWTYISKVQEIKNELKEEEETLRLAVYITVLMFEAKIWWVYNLIFFWVNLIKTENKQINQEFEKAKDNKKAVKSV